MLFNSLFVFIPYILFIPYIFTIETKTNICSNCKFFIQKNPLLYSKCFLFPKITKDSAYIKKQFLLEYLVTGLKMNKDNNSDIYYFCSTAREYDTMCGIEGSKYINKMEK